MAENYFGFNSVGEYPGDRPYTAADYMNWLKVHFGGNNGVVAGMDNTLNVTSLGAYNIQVDSGGAVFDGYTYYSSSAITKTLPAVATAYKRYDRVAIRFDAATTRSAFIYTITGTASTGTPSVPALGSTDIALATVYIDNTSGTPAYTVTDNRTYRAMPIVDLGITTAKLANGAVTDAKAGSLTSAAMASGYKVSMEYLGAISGSYTLSALSVGEIRFSTYSVTNTGVQIKVPATGTYDVTEFGGQMQLSGSNWAEISYSAGAMLQETSANNRYLSTSGGTYTKYGLIAYKRTA